MDSQTAAYLPSQASQSQRSHPLDQEALKIFKHTPIKLRKLLEKVQEVDCKFENKLQGSDCGIKSQAAISQEPIERAQIIKKARNYSGAIDRNFLSLYCKTSIKCSEQARNIETFLGLLEHALSNLDMVKRVCDPQVASLWSGLVNFDLLGKVFRGFVLKFLGEYQAVLGGQIITDGKWADLIGKWLNLMEVDKFAVCEVVAGWS